MKNIEVINYIATYENGEEVLVLGTYDSYGVEKLHVTFDKYWDDCLRIIASFKNNGLKTEVLVDSEGYVEVPPQATKYPTAKGVVSTLTFLGVKKGGQILSNDLKYKVLNHTEVQGQSPETTPSAWEKLVSNLGIPYFHINEEGELIVSLGAGLINAHINEDGDLIAGLSNDKTLNLGRVVGKTPEFCFENKILKMRYVGEQEWTTVADFSFLGEVPDKD